MLTHSYPMTACGEEEDFTNHNTLTSKDFLSSSVSEWIILHHLYKDALLNAPLVTVYHSYSSFMFICGPQMILYCHQVVKRLNCIHITLHTLTGILIKILEERRVFIQIKKDLISRCIVTAKNKQALIIRQNKKGYNSKQLKIPCPRCRQPRYMLKYWNHYSC